MSDRSEAWRDEAIKSSADDQLSRTHLAARAAALITQVHSWDSSVVFGLTGAWGSGKSSLIAMIEENLNEAGGDWAIARFTPWSASDTASLLSEFYSALRGVMPKRRGRNAKKALSVCARVAAPALSSIPYAGEFVSEGLKTAADALASAKPWDVAFREASAEIKAVGVPVLAIADDVDRLQADELMTLLKVVRLLGRFPGVNFLLAYDEKTLFNNLRRVGEVNDLGTEQPRLFMEKIVQYPFVVPPLLPTQIAVRVDEGLTHLMARAGRPLKRHEHRLTKVLDVFQSQLTTPRSIDRFLAQVEFVVPMHEAGEIDDVDLILLTFIRMQFPALWTEIQRWRAQLTGQVSMRHWANAKDQAPNWDELVAVVPPASRTDAREVLEEVFHIVRGGSARTVGVNVSNGPYFNRYFANTIPEDDVADSEIAEAIAEARTPGSAGPMIKDLLYSTYPGRADLALSKIRERFVWTSTARPAERADLNLVRVAADVSSHVDDGIRSMFSLKDQTVYWLADLLRTIPPDATADQVAEALSHCAEDGRRMWAVWEVLHKPTEAPAAIVQLAPLLADQAVEQIKTHMVMRDDAPEDDGQVFHLEFVREYGDVEHLSTWILANMGTNFELDDVAARFVSFSYLVALEPTGRLREFKHELFQAFLPNLVIERPQSAVRLNEWDISWANRRAFALAALGETHDPGEAP